MSRKQDKKDFRASNAAPSAAIAVAANGGDPSLPPDDAERIRTLIAERHSKAALQLAKDLFKRCPTSQAEALLVEAYKARIEDLLKLGMAVEARSLLGIVRDRFPKALPQLAEIHREINALDGNLDEVVRQLGDARLSVEERERIESFIRQKIHDLPALAAVSSLPPEHSLRVAAAALAAAFQAVTEGPIDEARLALPEVSRRSPLASWKALVRAIACYYRREDAECEKWLLTIQDDSVPARLLPAFGSMRGVRPKAGTESKFTIAEEKLITVAGDHGATLRPALAAFEKALHTKKEPLAAARSVVSASDRCDARLRERLRQHMAVRIRMLHVPVPSIKGALGGIPRLDAYYFRLFARALEEKKYAESQAEAVISWEDFRREALKENWFAANGLEDGILSLHMAETVESLPVEVIEEMHEREDFFRQQSNGKKGLNLPRAGELFQRACAADPHTEAFQMWLRWTKKNCDWRATDNVAEQWRKALPTDIEPLIYLMESTEKRDALKKSLGYLEEAEKLDRLNPEVRRAKLRLLLATVLRHLRQRKAHLAQGGIAQIEAVAETRPGDTVALSAALRWCAAAMDYNKDLCAVELAKLEGVLGNAAAHLLLAGLLKEAKLGVSAKLPKFALLSRIPALDLLVGTVRACVLADWVGLSIEFPQGWGKILMAAQYLPNNPLDTAQRILLGEVALENRASELAYAISSVGLAKGEANARFLFLRARALPRWNSLRRNGCYTAALELARRERNTELTGRILDSLKDASNGRGGSTDSRIASRAVSPELLGQILEEERTMELYPIYEGYQRPKYAPAFDTSLCDCPRCKARRGEATGGMEYVDDDDDFDDEDDFEDEDNFDAMIPPSMPNLMKRLEEYLKNLSPELAQKARDAMAEGTDPVRVIDAIVAATASKPKNSSTAKKADKTPPPMQGSLF